MPIIFDKDGMAEEAKKNLHSQIGSGGVVCSGQVFEVWKGVSEYIMDQLCRGHGVRIPELGTITYKVFTGDVSQRNVIVDKIPFILISETLVKKYALKAKRPPFNLDIPEVSLNMSAVAEIVGVSRSAVETCVTEVVQAFQRALVCDNYVEFEFPGIGRLVVECHEVRPVFASDFLCKYGFGDEIITDRCCAKHF